MPLSNSIRLLAAVAAIAIVACASAFAAIVVDRRLDDAADDVVAATPLPRDPPVIFEPLPAGYRIENVLSGLEAPTALDGSEDGRIFVAEQYSGAVQLIESGVLRETPFYVVPDLYVQADPGFVSELGLVGVTVEPGTGAKTFVYVYYSAQSAGGARTTKLVRLRDDGGIGVEPATILEIEGAPECCHIAGALTWLPDGTLLVGVGDHETHDAAQDIASPRGKVLRIDRDGNAPPDNPFVGDEDADPRVYAYGLRNPFGVAAAADGAMFVLDNGELGFDTIHRLEPGANYGWPSSAIDDPSQVAQPLLTYLESTGPAAAIFYDDGPLAAFDGMLLFCQFHRGGALHRFNPEPARLEADDVVLASGCSSGIRQLPDGYVYFLDYLNGALLRIVDGEASPFATN